MELWTKTMESPLGSLRLFASEQGLRALQWPGVEKKLGLAGNEAKGQRNPSQVPTADFDSGSYEVISVTKHSILDAACTQLIAYFEGKLFDFDLPLDPQGTEFQHEVWHALREIPYGTTMTYGEQASSIGRPKASRAVGAANGKNPLSIIVPCHRVIGANGKLTGFAGGLATKRFLLEHEEANKSSAQAQTRHCA